ncbi:acyl-CoA N-acyltransferase [Staphylotrichum tortipilum]|uniref:Acyl-CoA N-acyltransferase n=1 Tax=Staphylotrichum tortipilum TaxID=2831512 RepID=A0AAN6MED1_9PEZI|nr:acyl-CoA N-acyltransferase [Staphylotrichum longicolle]
MATALLEPTPLFWERSLPPSAQTNPSIPPTFHDAMTVRTTVFVQEQNIPQENEYDSDDARCAHWVLYADQTKTTPIGTIRLVPFPHPPHPVPGGVYVDGVLMNPSTSPSHSQPPATTIPAPSQPSSPPSSTPQIPPHPTNEEEDEEEPYLKLGRLAILPTHRRAGHAAILIRTALSWARSHPSYFDSPPAPEPSSSTSSPPPPTGPAGEQATNPTPRHWKGLILCHAQVDAVKVWERCGFRVDEAMGRWYEEGIEHVGCVLRVDVERAGEGV